MNLKAPACPRCAYDLSGIAAAWTNRCPLDGVCSECGLSLRWVDAYIPDRERVRGLFEHASGAGQSAWWAIRTLWLVVRPWTFWRRVTMAMTPRLGRVWTWSILMFVLLWIAGSVVANIGYLLARPTRPWVAVTIGQAIVNGWTQPIRAVDTAQLPQGPLQIWSPRMATLGVPDSNFPYRPLAWALAGAAMTWPLVFLLLPDTRRLGKLRRDHLLRAAGYVLAFLSLLALARLVHQIGWLVSCTRDMMAGRPAILDESPWGWTLPESLRDLFGRFNHDMQLYYGLLIGLPVLVWLQAWWLYAIVRGFRLERGLAIWALLAAVCLLVTPLAWLMAGGPVW